MKKCDPRAFARCPDKRFCGNIVDAEFMDGSDCDKFNQSVLAHPLTNADRIRCMSDEEIAEFLSSLDPSCQVCKISCIGYCCSDYMLEWLQQPAEEGDHD